MAKYSRWNYFIDKGLQTKYVIITTGVLVIHTFIVLVAIFAPYIMMMTLDYPEADKVQAARALLLLHGRAWPVIGIIILIFAALTVFMSHRIAGPIFNIKRGIRRIATGDLSVNIHLREKDEFHDVAEELNTLTVQFRDNIVILKENSALLEEHLFRLQQAVGGNRIDEQADQCVISEIRHCREAIQTILNRYHT